MKPPSEWAMDEARRRIDLVRRASRDSAIEYLASILDLVHTQGKAAAAAEFFKVISGGVDHVAH